MATITKTIGAGKDYATLLLWKVDLDSAIIYSAGDIARADCFKGVVFDGNHTISEGGTIGLVGIEVTAGLTERHSGIAGSGVKFHYGSGFWAFLLSSAIPITLEWLEVTTSDGGGGSHRGIQVNSASQNHPLRNMLVHDFSTASGANAITGGGSFGTSFVATRNTIYTCGFGIGGDSSAHTGTFDNNTVHDTGQAGFKLGTNAVAQNNVSTDSATSDYAGTPSSADHNSSSDSTATGTGSLTLKPASGIYISTIPGSENLQQKATGSTAENVALDLGTTPAGVNIDILGRDVDALGDVWDMGSHELPSGGGGPTITLPQIERHYPRGYARGLTRGLA